MKIFIDAGHNYKGHDTGAQGNGLKEQDITYEIAKKLGKLLVASGVSVKYSRNQLTDCVGTTAADSLNTRADMANQWGADVFVSIHCNAFTSVNAQGCEVLVYSNKGIPGELATSIAESISSRLSLVNRGVKERSSLVVLKRTQMPAVLIETAFISNHRDAELLANNQEDFAYAIFRGMSAILPIEGGTKMSQHWAQKYLDYLMEEKLMNIEEDRFDDNITRGEVFKIMALAMGYKE